MRNVTMVAGWLVLALLSGCAAPGLNWFKPATAKGAPQPVPSREALVRYLNENSVGDNFGKKVQSLSCDDINIKVTQGSQTSPNLNASLVALTPRNFFMRGKFNSSTCFELGSNNQEFWWWIKDLKGGPTNQYYCSYRDLQEGRAGKINFPLQPEWIIEILGLCPYGPPEKYQIAHDAETVRLIEKTTVQGRSVSKAIVFQRRPQRLPNPIVSDFLMIDDATGREICSAHIAEAVLDSKVTNAVLPRKIELNCPDMKVRMVMTLNDVAVNPGMQVLTASGVAKTNPGQPVPMAAFERRPIAGVPSVNLTGATPVGLQRVQGN